MFWGFEWTMPINRKSQMLGVSSSPRPKKKMGLVKKMKKNICPLKRRRFDIEL